MQVLVRIQLFIDVADERASGKCPMSATVIHSLRPLQPEQVRSRLASTPRLPSLGKIRGALHELLGAENRYITQISDVIRRDPSMTTRLLRMANSVYNGLSTPVSSVEEAVFYLGLKQIRCLVVATPIVEEFQKLAGDAPFNWHGFWQHCIATALLTNELVGTLQAPSDEMHYIGGLLHDVGKIVMASAFSQHFTEVQRRALETGRRVREIEREVLGMDHCELGALYLEAHRLPPFVVQVARFHHEPELCPEPRETVAVVQIADLLAHAANVTPDADQSRPDPVAACRQASGWPILFGRDSEPEQALALASLQRSLERLPLILEGLI